VSLAAPALAAPALACGVARVSGGRAYIQVLQREDDGVGHEHPAGLLGDGGRQDVGVDGEGEVVFARVARPPQRGVLRAEELTQVFVEHEHQLGDTCVRQ